MSAEVCNVKVTAPAGPNLGELVALVQRLGGFADGTMRADISGLDVIIGPIAVSALDDIIAAIEQQFAYHGYTTKVV